MRQVAEGLNYLHTANPRVIHRDLKLDNVLMRRKALPSSDKSAVELGLVLGSIFLCMLVIANALFLEGAQLWKQVALKAERQEASCPESTNTK